MSFNYYWMPDVYPSQFDTIESILQSSFNILCKEHKVKEKDRPNFIIRKSKVGPGAYFHFQNKLIVNLQSYKIGDETPIGLLCHEFGHFVQHTTGRFDLHMLKKGIRCFDNIIYHEDILSRVKDMEEYENLPWEKDAIEFSKRWEPVVKKKLRLKY